MEHKAAKDRIDAFKNADRLVQKSHDESIKAQLRAEQKHTEDLAREAKKRADAEIRAHDAVKFRMSRALGYGAASGVASGARTLFGVGAGMISGAMQLGGGFSIAGAVQERMAAEKSAALLVNAAYVPNATDGRQIRGNPKDVLNRARAVAISSGIDVNDLLEGTHSYVAKASDLKGGMANMEFFAHLAKGNGAKFGDVATAMGMLKAQNKGLSIDEAKNMMLNVVAQGRLGAVEMPDVAHVAAKITKGNSYFAMSQTEAQRQLLGLAQIGIKTGSAAEAGTAISNFAHEAAKHAGDIGLKTNQFGQIAESDIAGVFEQVFRKTGGNMARMGSGAGNLGFGDRSMRMLLATGQDYMEGYNIAKKAGGGTEAKYREAGVANVGKVIREATGATYTEADMQKDFGIAMDNPGERLDATIRKLNDALATALIPQIEKFTPILREMIPHFARMAEQAVPAFMSVLDSLAKFAEANEGIVNEIAAHPIGALMVGEVSKSIIQAGIGEGIRNALMNKGGMVAAFGVAAAAAMACAVAIDMLTEAHRKEQGAHIGTGIEDQNLISRIRANGTKEEVEAAVAAGKGRLPGARTSAAYMREHMDLTLDEKIMNTPDEQIRLRKSKEDEVRRAEENVKGLETALARASQALLDFANKTPAAPGPGGDHPTTKPEALHRWVPVKDRLGGYGG